MAAPILWAPCIFGVLSAGKTSMPIKFLLLGGGGFWVFLGGGVEVPILFSWAWGFFRRKASGAFLAVAALSLFKAFLFKESIVKAVTAHELLVLGDVLAFFHCEDLSGSDATPPPVPLQGVATPPWRVFPQFRVCCRGPGVSQLHCRQRALSHPTPDPPVGCRG